MVAYSPYTDVAPEKRLKSLITFRRMLPPSSDPLGKWFWWIAHRFPSLSWPESRCIMVTYSPYTPLSKWHTPGSMVFRFFLTPIFGGIASSTRKTIIHPPPLTLHLSPYHPLLPGLHPPPHPLPFSLLPLVSAISPFTFTFHLLPLPLSLLPFPFYPFTLSLLPFPLSPFPLTLFPLLSAIFPSTFTLSPFPLPG